MSPFYDLFCDILKKDTQSLYIYSVTILQNISKKKKITYLKIKVSSDTVAIFSQMNKRLKSTIQLYLQYNMTSR